MRYYQPFPAAIPLYEAGYPRVTHPSAAQSQNLQSEEIRLCASLDLHVLSTPPAFILSQDQTLIKKFSLWTQLASNLIKKFNFVSVNDKPSGLSFFTDFLGCVYKTQFVSEFSLEIIKISVRIFRVVSLFSYQGASCRFLLFCVVALSDSLFRLPYLSTNVNKYFNLFCLRFFSSNLSDVSRVSFVRITHRIRNCQYYFYFLFYLYNSHNLFEIFSTFLTTITLY